MATWDRVETHMRRVEYHVPTYGRDGAPWVEVAKAVEAARAECWKAGEAPGGIPADDTIRIIPGNDTVIVAYETPHKLPTEPPCDCQ